MVGDAQAKKAQAQAMLAERLKSVYMSGGRDQLLQMILLADSLQDLYNRMHLVSTLTDQDNQIISVALALQGDGQRVIFVSKDITARVKADAVGLTSPGGACPGSRVITATLPPGNTSPAWPGPTVTT